MEEGVRLVVEGLPSPFQVPKVKEFFNGRLFLFLSLFTVPNNSYKCQNDMTTFVILVLGQSRQKLQQICGSSTFNTYYSATTRFF